MNADERDELLWSAIESGTLDAATASDTEIAGRFAAHQKLESLFAMLCEPGSLDDPLNQPSQIGRYRVEGVLGEGAFGKVFLAQDPQLNRSVAIKIPRAGVFSSDQDAEDFLEEAKLAASLNHPGIVTIHDAGREAESCFIVMEYVDGRSLDQIVLERQLSISEIVTVVASIADALHHAHTRGFIHRDLKPGNVLVDAKAEPHVTDFGLAVSEKTQLEKVGQIAGTPAYMSPEQIRGETHRLDGRTDIWSLGVILYELLAGRHPFLQVGSHDCSEEILHREPKPPRQIDDDIPADLEAICLRCLSKDISKRYSTAADLADALRNRPKRLELPQKPPVVSSTRWRYAPWILLSALCVSVAVWVYVSVLPPSGDKTIRDTTQDKPPKLLDPTLLQKHPEIVDLLGMVYGESLEGQPPAAWIQVEHLEESASAKQWRPLKDGSRLCSGDEYRLILRAPHPTFFYVFQIDTHGRVDWAFPRNDVCQYSTGSNPVPQNATVKVPEGEQTMFILDDNLGIEHLYVIATTQRWSALEDKLGELGRSHGTVARWVDAPLELRLRGIGGITSGNADNSVPATGHHGVLAKEVWFHHVKPNADKNG